MPPVLEAPQLRPPRQRRKPTWTHRIVVTFMRLVILGVILGVGGGGKRRQSCADQFARPCLFSARTNLRQSGGGDLLRDSNFGHWTANQARELSTVGCAFIRRMAKPIVDCATRGERTAKVQVSRY